MPDKPSDTPASILLIDDHPLLRQGIKQLVETEFSWRPSLNQTSS